jgi:PBSX family phage terminase large subunit
MNEKNLVPFTSEQNREEAAKNGRKGGKASGEARRRKKNINQLAAMMLEKELSSKQKASVKKLIPDIEDDDLTVAAAMVAGQASAAIKGNTSAFLALAESAEAARKGEDSKRYELPARVIGKAYVDIYRHIEPNKKYVFEGGRGSLKSSFVSLLIVELLKNNKDIHACIVRKVGNTLKDSVYAQMKWAINILGLTDEFEYRVSPLEIRYRQTGQVIYFRGADDPVKLKSIKPEFGYIGILWKEEKDQLAGAAEERSINQSVLRGGNIAYDLSSYNPPKSKTSWVNKEKQIPDENRVIHSSTYLDAPPEWLGQKFIDDAEHLKEVNPEAYDHEYMGIPNGDGGNVFEYVEVRTITDEEIEKMDRIYPGVDFGWYPDQFCYLRTYYDAAREKIYLIDELYVNKWSNEKTAQWIKDKGYDDYTIICDSAEPKSVNDFRDYGLPARGAVKGAGSVEYGFKFLQRRTIVIDPRRTPNAYKEITEYEYERDKEGNVISGYPDGNDHAISALRYAYEPLFNRRGNSA